jgi:hypothetical protein
MSLRMAERNEESHTTGRIGSYPFSAQMGNRADGREEVAARAPMDSFIRSTTLGSATS